MRKNLTNMGSVAGMVILANLLFIGIAHASGIWTATVSPSSAPLSEIGSSTLTDNIPGIGENNITLYLYNNRDSAPIFGELSADWAYFTSGDTLGSIADRYGNSLISALDSSNTYYSLITEGFLGGQSWCADASLDACESYMDANFSSAYAETTFTVTPNTIPNIASGTLGQYKSDGVTSLGEGSTTMENTVVIEGTPEASSSDSLILRVELSTSTGSFANPIIVTSTPVASGEIASATITGLPDGDYHWQAQAMDVSTSASSSWQTESNPAITTDFVVHQVPLIKQGDSSWGTQPYADGRGNKADDPDKCGPNIANCGCAITSIAMVAQYYGIHVGVDDNPMTPFYLDAYLDGNDGYTKYGDVYWDVPARYANDSSVGVKLQYPTIVAAAGDGTTLDAELNNDLGLLEPAVLHSNAVGHYLVADDQLADTYAINDPAFYLTKTLDDDVANTTTNHNYNNDFNSIHLYVGIPESMAMTQDEYVTLSSPGELLITDPDGNQLGIDPVTSTTYNGIDGAVYGSEGISDGTIANPTNAGHETKYIWIPNPKTGTYNIQVIGTGSGGYTLQTMSYDSSGTSYVDTAVGSTTLDQISGYNLNLTPDEPDNITLTPQPSISSFSASPSSTVSGASSRLLWDVTNASSVTITPGSFSTSTLAGSITVNPTSTTVYTLTATSPNGTNTATTTIGVQSGEITFTSSTYNLGFDLGNGNSSPGIAFDSHTNILWVPNSNNNTVTQINDTTYASTTSAAIPGAENIVFDPHNNTIWIGGSDSIMSINDGTSATSTYEIPTDPYFMVFDSHNNTIWVEDDNTITQIDDTTGVTSTRSFAVSDLEGLTFDPNTNLVWIDDTTKHNIMAINDTTYATSTYGSFSYVNGLAFDPNSNSILISDSNNNTVTQINDTTYASTTFDVVSPCFMTTDSHTNSIWATNCGGWNAVTQIDESTQAETTYPTTSVGYGIVFDSYANSIWAEGMNDDLTEFTPSG